MPGAMASAIALAAFPSPYPLPLFAALGGEEAETLHTLLSPREAERESRERAFYRHRERIEERAAEWHSVSSAWQEMACGAPTGCSRSSRCCAARASR
jgi:hypothetical protein